MSRYLRTWSKIELWLHKLWWRLTGNEFARWGDTDNPPQYEPLDEKERELFESQLFQEYVHKATETLNELVRMVESYGKEDKKNKWR